MRRGIPFKSKTADAITVEGKVVGISWPKEYAYGGQWVERYFIAVQDAEGKEHKAMVTVVGNRERPFKGDTVRYTTKPEKDGWGSVTDKQDFEVLTHEGKESWLRYKREKEAREQAERAAREAEERAREAERRRIEQEQQQRARETEAKFRRRLEQTIGDYSMELLDEARLDKDHIKRILEHAETQPIRNISYAERNWFMAMVGADLLKVIPGATEAQNVYMLDDTGKAVLNLIRRMER